LRAKKLSHSSNSQKQNDTVAIAQRCGDNSADAYSGMVLLPRRATGSMCHALALNLLNFRHVCDCPLSRQKADLFTPCEGRIGGCAAEFVHKNFYRAAVL
jgi:hypothetical protein